VLTVAEISEFSGTVGNAINDYQKKTRKNIKFHIERERRLGPIANSELKTVPYPDMMDLDPKKWKDQDHYAIMGFPEVRDRATPEQLKKSNRKLVLKFHPDKCRIKDEKKVNDIITCINRANDVLSDPEKRRSYDSVDPKFDQDVPPISKNSKAHFFSTFGPVFDRNQRWSVISKVPFIGDEDSSLEDVNYFYEFWYGFQSWRNYSYLDKEDLETAEDAWDRREMKKANTKARNSLKKEEMTRIRLLVDNAYACDPRIKRFQEEEKNRKNQKKMQAKALKEAEDKKAAEEKELLLQQEKKEQAAADEVKSQQADDKKKRDKEKKAAKRERQKLNKFCKDHDYFTSDPEERISNIEKIAELVEALDTLTLSTLNRAVKADGTMEGGRGLIMAKIGGAIDDNSENSPPQL